MPEPAVLCFLLDVQTGRSSLPSMVKQTPVALHREQCKFNTSSCAESFALLPRILQASSTLVHLETFQISKPQVSCNSVYTSKKLVVALNFNIPVVHLRPLVVIIIKSTRWIIAFLPPSRAPSNYHA
jgi:hypothetical protein